MATANVQDCIVRQSSLKFCLEYYELMGIKPSIKEVIGLTNVIVDYCKEGYDKDLGKKLSSIEKILKDKYN